MGITYKFEKQTKSSNCQNFNFYALKNRISKESMILVYFALVPFVLNYGI